MKLKDSAISKLVGGLVTIFVGTHVLNELLDKRLENLKVPKKKSKAQRFLDALTPATQTLNALPRLADGSTIT